jgi:hypothetical protein
VKKRSAWFILSVVCFLAVSCAAFDDVSDIGVSLKPTDMVIIENRSYVSTVNAIELNIVRNGTIVYSLKQHCEVPANQNFVIKLDDFIIEAGDTVDVIDVNLSWSM